MIYHKEYKVSEDFLSDTSIKWRPTGNGEYIVAEKDGTPYFVKRNIHVRYPSSELPASVKRQYQRKANALSEKQKALKRHMASLTLSEHIIAEKYNFWDEEGKFVTVTPFLSDFLSDDSDFTALDRDQFLAMTRSVTAALEKLHACGVIHGDLKEKNVPVREEGGRYIPYIIDFDSAYTVDGIPDWENIGGSEGYQSPEVLLYGSDEGAARKETITPATDIFSLAIVFHRWWTGAFPATSMERATVGAAVYLGKEITLRKKFDFKIGPAYEATFISLLNWMLAKDMKARPTAKQVLDVLNDELEIPSEYLKGGDGRVFETELWSTHTAVAELYTVATLKKKGITSFKRINEGNGSAGLKYLVRNKDGKERRLSVEELCSEGYAKRLEPITDEPWEDDHINFATADMIIGRGYTKIERNKGLFKKGYKVTDSNGRSVDKSCKQLIEEGLAIPQRREIETDKPWPEHGSEYCMENMALLGVKSISRVEIAGEHRYKIVYYEMRDDKNKTNDNVSVNNLRLMGFIKK